MSSQFPLDHDTAPHPLTKGWIPGSYVKHVKDWLVSQNSKWKPDMLASKAGRDIELQMLREQGQQRFDIANVMRALVGMHGDFVRRNWSTHTDENQVWRDVLQFANPESVKEWPPFREMLAHEGNGVNVLGDLDFMDEFDRFAAAKDLNNKVVVLMNIQDCPRWSQQNWQ
ncbi:hypothetical protein BBK36DRAFT_1144818 [Trichoderma citrinoviride]|uniref:Uncharacterized protein n=1 Tax=Trichoderma citrinoviride TaxID=58853 RepID=A0A2T4AZ87_9HYPO|nr:hypothetical protein BBK36DRAFT_1144818 [Trichoderma citrinoviride]PTB62384.1 hypothetical protein BBK36DRAFT_1144818 [Trichoderma citrinoviride]